jgi:hypothetical protein
MAEWTAQMHAAVTQVNDADIDPALVCTDVSQIGEPTEDRCATRCSIEIRQDREGGTCGEGIIG